MVTEFLNRDEIHHKLETHIGKQEHTRVDTTVSWVILKFFWRTGCCGAAAVLPSSSYQKPHFQPRAVLLGIPTSRLQATLGPD